MEILLATNVTSAYTTIKIADNKQKDTTTMVIPHIS
jgi:hypothetical protein